MDKELKKIQEHYRENYFNKEIADQIKEKVHHGMNNIEMIPPEKKRNFSIIKRISYTAAACLLLFGLFLGSAFVSPAMAEVAAKIPFLNMIFEQKPIDQVIMKELEERGYKISGAGYSVPDKKFHVTVRGSEEYYNQVNGEIETITKELISSRGYDDFKLDVEKESTESIMIEQNERDKNIELVMAVLSKVSFELRQQGYKIYESFGAGYHGPESEEIIVSLEVEDTENRTDEIENAILEEVRNKGIQTEVIVELNLINVQAKETEMQWSIEVLPVIFEGMLNKKEYKTKGVGYSYKKGIMTIHITTTVEKSDKEAPVLAKKIENAIEDFLQSAELKDIVGDTPYKIIVEDKNHEEIN